MTNQAWNAERRLIFLWLGPIGALACLAALAAQFGNVDALDRVALPLLAAILLAMTGALGLKGITVAHATRISFLAAAVYFLLGLDRQFFWFVPHYQSLSESSYWFAVMYVTAFIAFHGERAIQVCAAMLTVSLLICVFHLWNLKSGGLLTYRMVLLPVC